MATLLDDLLDASLLRAGEPLALVRRPTDLVRLARHMAAQYQQTTERHEIQVHASEASLVGVWDPTRIERVLANLLSNAIKFSPSGGEILVSLARQGEAVREWAVQEWAVMQVRDHGVGVPMHDLPRVFEQFHRGHNVVGRVAGTGLGLAGVRQIVEQHGGTISVESQEGCGATFTLRLPLSPEQDAAPAPEPGRTS
jgi:signal transduction histidine kinase